MPTAIGIMAALSPCAGSLAFAADHAALPGQARAVFQRNMHDALYAISFEGRNGIAVGDFGLVVETADGGVTWNRRSDTFSQLGLFAVARKQGRCIAAGQQGAIYYSDDCRKWQAGESMTQSRILSVDVNSKGVAYAVGGFGTLLKSVDWGKTWQVLVPDWKTIAGADGTEPHLYAVQVNESGQVTVTGEFELILRSTDGNSWNVLHKGKASLFALQLLDNGLGLAVGQEGTILRTIDHGAHWQRVGSGSAAILTGVSATPDGQAVATGIYTILRSRDEGKTWQPDHSRVSKSGSHHGIAAGISGQGKQAFFSVGARGEILSIGQ